VLLTRARVTRSWFAVLSAVVVLVGLAVLAGPAGAQTSERITRYDSDLTVEHDGGLLVRETITYDFGSTPRHGIIRTIPVRADYPPRANHDRVYPIDVLSVTASGGASADHEESEDGNDLNIRIGDPDRVVTGEHTYEITYRVHGAYNGFPDHDELNWNVIGNEWQVPIESGTAVVHTPAGITQVACFTGYYSSVTPCGTAVADGSTATFTIPESGLHRTRA